MHLLVKFIENIRLSRRRSDDLELVPIEFDFIAVPKLDRLIIATAAHQFPNAVPMNLAFSAPRFTYYHQFADVHRDGRNGAPAGQQRRSWVALQDRPIAPRKSRIFLTRVPYLRCLQSRAAAVLRPKWDESEAVRGRLC